MLSLNSKKPIAISFMFSIIGSHIDTFSKNPFKKDTCRVSPVPTGVFLSFFFPQNRQMAKLTHFLFGPKFPFFSPTKRVAKCRPKLNFIGERVATVVLTPVYWLLL
jgi:hypothetical protein